MDWQIAIEKHRAALQRVLAALAGMAGAGPQSPPAAGEKAKSTSWLSQVSDFARGGMPPTLPRHLHRAVLRLLRPAEAAARRLVIVAARGIEMPPPALRATSPVNRGGFALRPAATRVPPLQSGGGVAAGDGGGGTAPPYPTRIALPLTDPLRRSRGKVLRASRIAVPRICVPGWSEPAPLPPKPEPHDAIDARRLLLRLSALARALDDLPREARRFARWQARNRARFQDKAPHTRSGRPVRRRVWPLRFGRPPGQLSPRSRRPRDAVHQILEDLHGLANWVLEAPDTS